MFASNISGYLSGDDVGSVLPMREDGLRCRTLEDVISWCDGPIRHVVVKLFEVLTDARAPGGRRLRRGGPPPEERPAPPPPPFVLMYGRCS